MEDICSILRMSMGMLHFAETMRRKANSIRSLIRSLWLVEVSGASVREMEKFACASVAPVMAFALAFALANALQGVYCQ